MADFDPTNVNLTDPNIDAAKVICALTLGGNEYNGNLGARVSAVFVIMIVSSAATFFPVLASRMPSLRIPVSVYIFARYFGAGVIVATAFIHLLDPAYSEIGGASCVGMTGAWAKYSWCPAIVLMSVVVIFLVDLASERYVETKYGVQSAQDVQTIITTDAAHAQPHLHDHDDNNGSNERQSIAAGAREKQSSKELASHDSEAQSAQEKFAFRQQIAGFLILEFGVIFHSVVIGLNLGVVGDEFSTLYPVLIFHQSFEGLGIGARLSAIPFPPSKLAAMAVVPSVWTDNTNRYCYWPWGTDNIRTGVLHGECCVWCT